MGALYNGQARKMPKATAWAPAKVAPPQRPAWYTGQEDAQAHHAALSGIRTRQLAEANPPRAATTNWSFDDSRRQSRLELSSDQHDSRCTWAT